MIHLTVQRLALKNLSNCITELLHTVLTHASNINAPTADDINAVLILELIYLHLVQTAVGKHSILWQQE